MPTSPIDPRDLAAMLAWQAEAGADEAILETPVDRYKASITFPVPPKFPARQVTESARAPAGMPLSPRPVAKPAPAKPAAELGRSGRLPSLRHPPDRAGGAGDPGSGRRAGQRNPAAPGRRNQQIPRPLVRLSDAGP